MTIERLLHPLFSSRICRAGPMIVISLLLAAIPARSVTTNLNLNDSINLEPLIANGMSVQVGDKLFGDFSFQYSDTSGNPANSLPTNSITVTALSNPFGYGIKFFIPFAATGNNLTKDILLDYSVTVTDPHQLISDVHMSFNGAVVGSGLSEVTETITTNGFGANPIAQLNVYNLGTTNPVLSDFVNLIQPTTKLFIEKDIMLELGPGDLNSASLSIISQNFSQIPEPSTILLAGAGGAALLMFQRRKRAKTAE